MIALTTGQRTLLLVTASVFLLNSWAPQAGADDSAACKRYATESVRQNGQNIALKAGFSGPAWQSDFAAHFNWCQQGHLATTPGHLAAREKALQEYAVKSGKDAAKRYATEAVRQNEENTFLKAGFSPPVWSSDFKGHYDWSRHGRNLASTPGHLAHREKLLQEYAIKHKKGPRQTAQAGKFAIIKPIQGAVIKPGGGSSPPAIKSAGGSSPKVAAVGGGNKVMVNAHALVKARINRADMAVLTPENPIFDIYVGEDVGQPVHIGRGYNSLLKKPTYPAVDIPQDSLRTLLVNKAHSESGYARSMEDYYKHLGVDIKASGSYFGFSGSSRTEFESSEKNHKFHERYVASVHVETALEFTDLVDLKLNQRAADVLKKQGVNEFYRQYGDSFVYAIQYGAGLRAVGTYQLLNKEESFAFRNQTSVSGDWLIADFDVSTDVSKESRKRKEEEVRQIVLDPFGGFVKHPDSIEELRGVVKDFAQNAGLLAQQSTSHIKNGGIIYYTVMKYSELPDFQQIAGANALNLKEQRKLLDQLSYYRRRIQYMQNNLDYVVKNPAEFKPREVQNAKSKKGELTRYLQSVEHDIAIIQQYPLDRSKWRFNPGHFNYEHIPDYAPATRFVRVKIHFPAEYRHPNASSSHDWWAEHVGPLIGGYSHVKGDDETSGRKIDINLHNNLEARAKGREAWLKFDFLEKENGGDYTTFHGTRHCKVYQAPQGYTIVGFRKAKEDYYLRDLNINTPYAQGFTIQNVNATFRDKTHFLNYPVKDPLWTNLSVIFDTSGGDDEIGVFGDLEIEVELKETEPEV